MEQYSAFLQNTSIFSGMSREEIKSILQCLDAKKENYSKGSVILRAGSSTESMGLLLSGKVLVIQEDIWGHRSIMDLISPGDFLANHSPPRREASSMSASWRTVTVKS